jgi:hypothetical protein
MRLASGTSRIGPLVLILLLAILQMAFQVVRAKEVSIADRPNALRVVSSNEAETVLEMTLGSFQQRPIRIDGDTYYRLRLPEEGISFARGMPELPQLTRSLIIPDQAAVRLEELASEFCELPLAVAPSRGLLAYGERAEDAPYVLGAAYDRDEFYPAEIAVLGAPYVLRDFRAVTVTISPFAYNPRSQTLRVCTYLRLRIRTADAAGTAPINPKLRARGALCRPFLPIYAARFLNFPGDRYVPVQERGRMVVISHPDFLSAVQPYVDWKNQKGIPTELWDVTAIGDTPEEIHAFVADQYTQGDLVFLQLVGDEAFVPTFLTEDYYGWGIRGRSDARYAMLEGADQYPEIFVGRFSCEDVPQLQTQVERTLWYERDLDSGAWLHRGAGLGTVWGEGYGYNGWNGVQSLEVIRGDLLGYHYTEVAQLYEEGEPPFAIVPVEAWEVTEVLHDGIGILNVDGNADRYYLDTGSYAIEDVNALENEGMLPFIFLAAPWCGNFGYDCFSEAWLRATHGVTGAPTGAVAVYTSSNALQYAPPQAAMHEMVDLLVAEEKHSFGGLMYNGACFMMDLYGSPDEYETFANFNILGDASLQVRTDTPAPMNIVHEPEIHLGETQFAVATGVADALVCLSEGAQIVAAGYADETGAIVLAFDAFSEETELLLTVTAYDRITSIEVVPVTGGQGMEEPQLPWRDALIHVGPNPAQAPVAIEYALGGGGPMSLEISDVSGRELRTLTMSPGIPGRHTFVWDGDDGNGRPLPSGEYFVRLTTDRVRVARRITLLR